MVVVFGTGRERYGMGYIASFFVFEEFLFFCFVKMSLPVRIKHKGSKPMDKGIDKIHIFLQR